MYIPVSDFELKTLLGALPCLKLYIVMWGFSVWSLFRSAIRSFVSSFLIISLGMRELVALLNLPFNLTNTVSFLCRFLVVPRVYLQCAVVAFPCHTHLLSDGTCYSKKIETILLIKNIADG